MNHETQERDHFIIPSCEKHFAKIPATERRNYRVREDYPDTKKPDKSWARHRRRVGVSQGNGDSPVTRAVGNLAEPVRGESEFASALEECRLSDANGSGKVALIAIERSIGAWLNLQELLPR